MSLSKYIRSVLLLALVLLFGVSALVRATENDGREYKLKAAFLLNFPKFITWPEDAFQESEEGFDLCIVGKDPFGTALDGLESKQVGGRQVRLHYSASIEGAGNCHLMFIAKSEEKKLDQLQTVMGGRPVITVSDIVGFTDLGGTFEFLTKSGRLSFLINNKQATESGFKINASLLSLAAEVL